MRVQNTPYQMLKHSKPGQFVAHNKLLTGVAGVGSSIVVAGGAAQSEGFAQAARYGIVPAAAAAVATVGALAAHDAIVNDFGEDNVKGAVKLAGGATLALGGAQVVGLSYDIPYLDRALTGPLGKVFDNGQAVLGAAVGASAVAAGNFAAHEVGAALSSQGQDRARHGALAVGAAAGTVAGALGSAELFGRNFKIAGLDRAFTGTVEALAQSSAAAVGGGALLVGGGAVLAGEAVQGGNDFLRVAEGMGAVSAALGGVQLAGHGLGLQATEGLLTHHADVVGSVGLSAIGAALVKDGVQGLSEGLSATRSAELAAGAAAVPGGLALAALSLGQSGVAEALGRTSGVAGALGLGLTAAGLAQNAVQSGQQGSVGSAAGFGVLAAGAASAGLMVGGEALGIHAVTEFGEKVAEHTLLPVWEHVISPSAQFLFENPVAGAVVLAAGVGSYIYFRKSAVKE